jgi:uncharacterized membrane protein (DUF485 family)
VILYNRYIFGDERRKDMYTKAFGAIQIVNIVVHSFFTLAMYIALGVLLGWLSVEKWGAPKWAYVPFIVGGVLIGFISMVRFIIFAFRGYERLERERREKYGKGNPPSSSDS